MGKREIKFRAWDKENRFMINDFFIDADGFMFDWAKTTYNTPNIEIEAADYVIMQYTGLKDKNGVEIYEGDIVEYIDFDLSPVTGDGDEFLNRGVIEWDEYMFSVSNKQDVEDEDLLLNTKDILVIGNIYEHPHLISSKQEE